MNKQVRLLMKRTLKQALLCRKRKCMRHVKVRQITQRLESRIVAQWSVTGRVFPATAQGIQTLPEQCTDAMRMLEAHQ